MASYRKRGKNWYYTLTDEHGDRSERKGHTNRRATEELAQGAELRVARIKAGQLDPKADRFAAESRKSVSEHLADFAGYLLSKGGNRNHARVKAGRARRLLVDVAGCVRLGDITITSVQGALGRIAGEGKSIQTANHYLDAAKMFCSWLVRDARSQDSPIAYLSRRSPLSDLRRVRRSLTAAECGTLIDALATAQDVLGIPATDRAALYLIAIGTGFRAAEIRSLTPERFNLDGPRPSIVVTAGYTKNRREAIQPINPQLAGGLKPWLATKEPGRPIFRMPLNWFAPMLQSDLTLAGIPARTDDGVVDFHALRNTFISLLVSSGSTVKETQLLARHSTPVLTFGTYAKAHPEQIADAIGKLPTPNLTRPEKGEAA